MNDDAFEKKLESLAGALPRPDPTAPWKADILARARREAGASAVQSRRILPPRWLMTVWGTAWVAIALMRFSTPADSTAIRTAPQLVEAKRAAKADAHTHATASSSMTLLAFDRELSNATSTRFDIP
jgi:hypothetical protein